MDEVARLQALQGAEINEAKKRLADEVTALVHGPEAAAEAAETARRTFEEGAAGEALPTLTVTGEIGIVAALTTLGLATSNGEARRKLAEGAVRLNGVVIKEPTFAITLETDEPVKLSLGKKKHALLVAG
jgi:tyrosyl-tRNA synthetase